MPMTMMPRTAFPGRTTSPRHEAPGLYLPVERGYERELKKRVGLPNGSSRPAATLRRPEGKDRRHDPIFCRWRLAAPSAPRRAIRRQCLAAAPSWPGLPLGTLTVNVWAVPDGRAGGLAGPARRPASGAVPADRRAGRLHHIFGLLAGHVTLWQRGEADGHAAMSGLGHAVLAGGFWPGWPSDRGFSHERRPDHPHHRPDEGDQRLDRWLKNAARS
jgi:hypothetical protein